MTNDAALLVEAATLSDAAFLPGIEARAAALFDPQDLPSAIAAETTSADDYAIAAGEGRVLIARLEDGSVAGFALMLRVDGSSHLEELDVDPAHGRQGIGRALVARAIRWAEERGDTAITLSTFAHVPWNAPFYATMGFEVLPRSQLPEALLAIRKDEEAMGFDVSKRVVMRCRTALSEAPSRNPDALR